MRKKKNFNLSLLPDYGTAIHRYYPERAKSGAIGDFVDESLIIFESVLAKTNFKIFTKDEIEFLIKVFEKLELTFTFVKTPREYLLNAIDETARLLCVKVSPNLKGKFDIFTQYEMWVFVRHFRREVLEKSAKIFSFFEKNK